MSLNIKNERVHDLVRTASRVTGLSQTAVVEQAVEQFLREATRESRDARLGALLRDVHEELVRTGGPLDVESLYDPETGLPR